MHTHDPFTKPVLDCPESVFVLQGTILYAESCIVLPGSCTCLVGYYPVCRILYCIARNLYLSCRVLYPVCRILYCVAWNLYVSCRVHFVYRILYRERVTYNT